MAKPRPVDKELMIAAMEALPVAMKRARECLRLWQADSPLLEVVAFAYMLGVKDTSELQRRDGPSPDIQVNEAEFRKP